MAWVSPVIHAVGDVLTASDWNVTSRDVSFVAGTGFGSVSTSQTTASGTYADLSSVGPAATVTTGTNAVVLVGAYCFNSTVNNSYASYAVSGATTVAANDVWAVVFPDQINTPQQVTFLSYQGGLTPGSNTFTMKYRVNGGTATFANRYIAVFPQP